MSRNVAGASAPSPRVRNTDPEKHASVISRVWRADSDAIWSRTSLFGSQVDGSAPVFQHQLQPNGISDRIFQRRDLRIIIILARDEDGDIIIDPGLAMPGTPA